MQELRHLLVQEQKRLETIINKARSGLESAPEGRLRISCDKSKPRYYQYMSADNETYIPKAEMELARLLAQKNYNESVVKKAEARLKQIKKITKNYSDDEIEKIYTSMNKERQALVTPVESTWDQLLKMWYEEEYQGKEFKEGTPLILTEKESDLSLRKYLLIIFIETIYLINMRSHSISKDMVSYIQISHYCRRKLIRKFIGNMKE